MRLTALLLFCATPAVAQEISLDFPVDCTLGDTCYLQNYVDHDPSNDASDFMCGDLTYDTHKGTDFGLPSLAAMNAGVNVLAAAPGTVRGVRNNMRDVLYTPDLDAEINGRDCGNGLVITHENGWETQYCHLKEGSVAVQTGQSVQAGTILGEIGLSGRTQFPHLHLSVRQNGRVVDPFDPDGDINCGTPSDSTLWAAPIATPQGGLLAVGFSDNVPEFAAVKAGTAAAEALSAMAPIVVWGLAFGAQPDDIMRITIDGPDGAVFNTDVTLNRTQALVMRAGGRRAPDTGWPAGHYDGYVAHIRDGVVLGERLVQIALR